MADPKVLREIRYHATETTEMCWQAGFSSTDAAARWAATHGNNLLDALGRICNPPTDCDPKKWAENCQSHCDARKAGLIMTFHCRCGIKEAELDYPNCKNGEWDAQKPEPHTAQAVHDVLAERRRQVEAEGWTPEHDDEHTGFELARAGACYAEYGNWPAHSEIPPNSWPWSAAWWKPTSYRQNLVKAAALILAEIERLDRIQPPKGKG